MMESVPGEGEIEERGSFSHGVCRLCGWRGPGRRSRRLAKEDSRDHQQHCPGEELVG